LAREPECKLTGSGVDFARKNPKLLMIPQIKSPARIVKLKINSNVLVLGDICFWGTDLFSIVKITAYKA